MWPGIIRDENGVGKAFYPDFWRIWGPTEVKFLNLKTDKDIQSIYCIYDSYDNIQINDKNSIALALTYECEDFGQHSAFFSYDKKPQITYNKIWDYCVFSDFDSDEFSEIFLYQLGVMDINLEMLSLDMMLEWYCLYLEDKIDVNNEVLREIFSYIANKKSEPHFTNYLDFLESILKAIWDKVEILRNLRIVQKDGQLDLKRVDDIISSIQAKKSDVNGFRKKLSEIQNKRVKNDLKSIFEYCIDELCQGQKNNGTETFEKRSIDVGDDEWEI